MNPPSSISLHRHRITSPLTSSSSSTSIASTIPGSILSNSTPPPSISRSISWFTEGSESMLTDLNNSDGSGSIGSLCVIAGSLTLAGLVGWTLVVSCAGAEDLCMRRLGTRRLPSSGDVSGVESDLTATTENRMKLTVRRRLIYVVY